MKTMFLVVLEAIEGGQELRTKKIKGIASHLPEEGKSIALIADGLSPFSIREAVTSSVVHIDRERSNIEKLVYFCRTETGSLYRFEVEDFKSIELDEEIFVNC